MNEELKVILKAETKNLRKNVNKAEKEVEDFGNEVEDVSEDTEEALDKVDKAFEDTKESIGNALKAVGASLVAGTTAIIGMAESTREYRTAQDKLNSAFNSAGASAGVAEQTYKSLQRVLGDTDTAVEAANHLAKLTTNQEKLAEYTKICQGVFAQFGDSLPIEGLTEAINHTAKLGEVQGVLADALEWNGVNVDNFNDKLAKLKTESEREQLIRETLISLYAESAEEYEKTAKSVLDANSAQERLNSSMASVGGALEPVVASLKNFAADMFEEVEEPISDVAKWLGENVPDAFNRLKEWFDKNSATVIGTISGLTAGIVAFRMATEGADKITALFNATLSTLSNHPYASIASAFITLATVAITCSEAQYEAHMNTTYLTEAELDLMDANKKLITSYKDRIKEAENSNTALMNEKGYAESLWKELESIVDSNGKVIEGYETRATWIAEKLSTLTDKEISLNDGVIKNYKELKDSIYEIIDAKTASALLEANNDAYISAIQAEAGAFDNLTLAEKDYMAQKEVYEKAYAEYTREREELDKKIANAKTSSDYRSLASDQQRVSNLETNLEWEKDLLSKKEDAYNDYAIIYSEIQNTISDYEDAQVASMEDNSQKVIDLLTEKSNKQYEYADNVDEATQEVLEVLRKEAIDAGIEAERIKKNFEDGIDGYTKEMVEEAEKSAKEAISKFAHAKADAELAGEDLSDGFASGIERKKKAIISKATEAVKAAIEAARKAADSHSPSRKMIALGEDMGEGAEIGLDNTTKDVAKAGARMAENAIMPMEIVAQNDFSAFERSDIVGELNVKSIDSDNRKSLSEELFSLLADSNTPIVLQVDGKTLAEISCANINKLTRQRGSIPLIIA